MKVSVHKKKPFITVKLNLNMAFQLDPTNNLPSNYKQDPRQYREINYQDSRAFRVQRVEPLTDEELEALAEAFKYIDEYDKRNNGQQFND